MKLSGQQMIDRMIYTALCVATLGVVYVLRLVVTVGVEKAQRK